MRMQGHGKVHTFQLFAPVVYYTAGPNQGKHGNLNKLEEPVMLILQMQTSLLYKPRQQNLLPYPVSKDQETVPGLKPGL
jgi:hypothetical protein